MRFIRLNEDNMVTSTRIGKSIVGGEMQSETGEIGQIMQIDGTFIDAPIEEVAEQPTLEDKVTQLQSDNLILMDALAVTFEEILILQSKVDAMGGTV